MAHNVYSEFNLNDIITAWGEEMFETSDSVDGDKENYEYHPDFRRMKFVESEPQYNTAAAGASRGAPKAEVLYETTLKNDTKSVQFCDLGVEKTSTSVAKIDMSRALVINNKTRLRLKSLPRNIPKSAGFGNEVDVHDLVNQEIKEKAHWKINPHIKMRPKSVMKVQVTADEKAIEGNFSVKTTMTGNAHVDVTDPNDNNSITATYDGNIAEITDWYVRQKQKIKGVTRDGKNVTFESTGHCSFRFHVEQNVVLTPIKDGHDEEADYGQQRHY